MSDPTSGGDLPPHTTTIEISGNGQVNAAFEDTEGGPRTPPPPRETSHMNGETKSNGEAKQQNGVELRTPGSESLKDSEMAEAVNLELVNMQPSYTNSIPIKKESTQLDIGDPYDEYFVPVNQHKKYMRGEKLYVTQDKRRTLGGSSKKCCWGLITVIVLGAIVAILIGVILTSQEEAPLQESRTFNGHKASIGGGIVPTPPPSSTAQPPRPTTDMTEMILNHVLQGELTIDNLEFTPGLADKNSSEFKNLASSLEEELKPALFDHQTLRYGAAEITVKVLEFKSGSVVVSYRVGWEFKTGLQNPPDPIDKDGLKTRLQEHLRNNDGFLYNYRLPLHTLKSENVMNECQFDNGGCDQICSFNSTSLQFACSCEDSYMLESDSKTCVKIGSAESVDEHEPNSEPEPSAEPEPEPTLVHDPSSESSVENETEPHSEHEPTVEPVPSEHEPEPSSEPKPASEPTVEHATDPSLGHEPEPKPTSEHETEPSAEPKPSSDHESETSGEPESSLEPEPSPEPKPSTESPTSQKMETDTSPEPTILPPQDSERSEPSSQQEHYHQIGVSLDQEQHSEISTEAHSSSTKESLTESVTEADISKHSIDAENIGGLSMGSTSNLPSQENTIPETTSHPEETTMPEMKSEDPSKPIQDITTPSSGSSSSHIIAEHDIIPETSEEPETRSENEMNAHLSENLAQGQFNETSSEELSHMSSSTESEVTGSSESSSPSLQNGTSSIMSENGQTSSSSTESVEADSFNSMHSLIDIPKESQNKTNELINTEVPLEMRHREFPTTIGSQKSQSTTESSESTLLNEFDGEFSFGKPSRGGTSKNTNEPPAMTTMTDSHAPTTLGNFESQTVIPQKIVDPMTMNEHEPATNASITDSTEIHLGVDVHSSSTSEEMSLSSEKNTSPTESFMSEAKPFEESKTKTEKIESDDLSPTEIYNMVTENPTLNTEMVQKSTEKAMPMEITVEKATAMPEVIEVGTFVDEPMIKPTTNSTVDNVTSRLGLNSEITQISDITTEINPQRDSELTTLVFEKENATTQSSDTSKNTSEKQINELSSQKPNDEPKLDAATSSSTTVEKQIITTDNNTNATMSGEKSENEATTLKSLEESMTMMTQIPDLSGPFSVDSILLPPSDDDIREENSKVVDPLIPNHEENHHNPDENDSKNWYDAKNDLNSLDDDYNEEENHKYYKEKNSNLKEKHYKNFKIEEIGSPHDSDAVEQKHSHRIHEAPFANMSHEDTVDETKMEPSAENNKEITTSIPVSSSSTTESSSSTDRQERNRKELEVENKTNIPGESSNITVSGITYKPLLNEDSTVAITTIDDTEVTTIKNPVKVTKISNDLNDLPVTQRVNSENVAEINKEVIITSTPGQEMEINKTINDSDPHYVIYLDPSNVTDGVPSSTESHHSFLEVKPEASANNETLLEKPVEIKIVEEKSTAPSVSETEKLLTQENPIIFEQNGSTTSRPEVMSPSSDQSLQHTSEIVTTTSQQVDIGIQSSSSSPIPLEHNVASSEANLQSSTTETTAEIENQEKNTTLEIGVSAVHPEIQAEILNSNLTSKLNLTLPPYPYMNTTLLDRMNMSSKCASGQFACADGSGCLRSIQRCDSVSDCKDGSDEMHCQEEGCPGNFQCESGQCLKRYHVCNSKKDCSDGSDELNCEKWQCKFDELRCSSGECIPILWKCDGKPDCPGNTDEHNCKDSCNNDEFLCPEGWCIPLSQKCDGIRQCTNGEDELECSS